MCAQSCLTLWNPMDCSPLGSSVHRISQARILEWVAISLPRGSSGSRDQIQVCTAGLLFTVSHQGRSNWSSSSVQFSSVAQSCPTLCPWTAACQASLFITNCLSLLKFMSIESVMPSNHLILCLPLILPPSIFPRISVFSNESVHLIRWPKYWSFSFSISPSNE